MIAKFYVDIDALGTYAKSISTTISDVNKSIGQIALANKKYQQALQDNISADVDLRIRRLKKIFEQFSEEMNKMSKKVQEDYVLYQAYIKRLK